MSPNPKATIISGHRRRGWTGSDLTKSAVEAAVECEDGSIASSPEFACATRKHIGNWRPEGNEFLLAVRRYVESRECRSRLNFKWRNNFLLLETRAKKEAAICGGFNSIQPSQPYLSWVEM